MCIKEQLYSILWTINNKELVKDKDDMKEKIYDKKNKTKDILAIEIIFFSINNIRIKVCWKKLKDY